MQKEIYVANITIEKKEKKSLISNRSRFTAEKKFEVLL